MTQRSFCCELQKLEPENMGNNISMKLCESISDSQRKGFKMLQVIHNKYGWNGSRIVAWERNAKMLASSAVTNPENKRESQRAMEQ